MADYTEYDAFVALQNRLNELDEFVRNLKTTSLKPPMPSRVLYTTPEIVEKLKRDIENMRANVAVIKEAVEELEDELEDFQNEAR